MNSIIEAVKQFCEETGTTYRVQADTGDIHICLGTFTLFTVPNQFTDRFRVRQHERTGCNWIGHLYFGDGCDPNAPRTVYDPEHHGEKIKRQWDAEQTHTKIDNPQAVYDALIYFYQTDHTTAALEVARQTLPKKAAMVTMPPILK